MVSLFILTSIINGAPSNDIATARRIILQLLTTYTETYGLNMIVVWDRCVQFQKHDVIVNGVVIVIWMADIGDRRFKMSR